MSIPERIIAGASNVQNGYIRQISPDESPLPPRPWLPSSHQLVSFTDEPHIDDILSDPIILRLMRSDSVQMTSLLTLMRDVQKRRV